MNVMLLDFTPNPEVKIAKYAAICYNSPTDDESVKKRIKHLMKVKHLATLRFAYATFLVEDVSRACSHQLVRHPHLSYLQQSQRYVGQQDTSFTSPFKMDEDASAIIEEVYRNSLEYYNQLLDLGVKKEDARYILPAGVNTSLFITGNFQAWYDFLKNRTDPHAQWEIRGVAEKIAEELNKIAPNIFKEFV